MINFILEDEELESSMLRDSVEKFCEGQGGLGWSRKHQQAEQGNIRRIWKLVAEQGWLGLRVPEADSGLGLGIGELAAMHEQWGRVAAPVSLAAFASLGIGAIARSDNTALKEALLPELMEGALMIALAWQSSADAMTSADVTLGYRRQADGGFVLSGRAELVFGGSLAHGYVVAARSTDGSQLFWVPADTPGITKESRLSVDFNDVATLVFDDVSVRAGSVVAEVNDAARLLDQLLDEARIAVSAELLGLSKATLEMTLSYLSDRKQFGRAIGSNQALQHRAVNLYIEVNLAQAALLRAVRVASDPAAAPDDLAKAAWACKSRCSETALHVTREAIQMHGGIGYTEECNVSLFVRRALTQAAWLGDARSCRAIHHALNTGGEHAYAH